MRYGEGVFVGYRGYDALDRDVSYPFGHGLSYTSFDYADLQAAVTGRVEAGDLAVEVTCRVTNTGTAPRQGGRAALRRRPRGLGRPAAARAQGLRQGRPRSAGESETVTFRLDARDLSYWSSAARAGCSSPASSRWRSAPPRATCGSPTTLDVAAPLLPRPARRDGELEEWLADPAGAPLLHEVVGTDETGRPRGILGDDELRAVVGNFPIGALTAFPGSGLDQGTVDELLRRLRDRRAP